MKPRKYERANCQLLISPSMSEQEGGIIADPKVFR